MVNCLFGWFTSLVVEELKSFEQNVSDWKFGIKILWLKSFATKSFETKFVFENHECNTDAKLDRSAVVRTD